VIVISPQLPFFPKEEPLNSFYEYEDLPLPDPDSHSKLLVNEKQDLLSNFPFSTANSLNCLSGDSSQPPCGLSISNDSFK